MQATTTVRRQAR